MAIAGDKFHGLSWNYLLPISEIKKKGLIGWPGNRGLRLGDPILLYLFYCEVPGSSPERK